MSSPPTNCLQGVSNSKWIFNSNLGFYQAFQSTSGMYLIYLQRCQSRGGEGREGVIAPPPVFGKPVNPIPTSGSD